MINTPLILLLIILSSIGVYLAGKYNLLARFLVFGKKIPKEKLPQINFKKLLDLPKKHLKIIAVIGCGIIFYIIVSTIYNKITDSKAKKEGCQPFTPLFLQKYKIVSGEKPILGERCTLSSKSFLVKLLYGNAKQAQNALTGLAGATAGERKTLEDYTWITYRGSSSIFLVDGQKVGVLVLLGENRETKVKTELDKVLQDQWSKESGNLTYDPLKLTTSPAAETSFETEEILTEARRYVEMHGEVIKFDVKLTKKLDPYALVQVIPQQNIEGAAVILEKVDNHWVAQEMGTIFPEWEKRVPELFNGSR